MRIDLSYINKSIWADPNSKIEIGDLYVENAQNDCFDVSSGFYTIKNSSLSSCEDKGVSVGDKSQVHFEKLNIENAAIGISSKDLSQVYVNKVKASSVELCYEVFQKKQEFGGACLSVDQFVCASKLTVDDKSHSEVVLNWALGKKKNFGLQIVIYQCYLIL